MLSYVGVVMLVVDSSIDRYGRLYGYLYTIFCNLSFFSLSFNININVNININIILFIELCMEVKNSSIIK